MRSLKNRKGVTQLVLGIVVGLIFLAVVLPVGLGIWQATTSSFSQSGWTAAANSTMTAVTTNIGSGFNLMAIAPLVVAAGGIITILVYAFVFKRGP